MGLDQYAYRIKNGEALEIAYWRKHNRLQGWMENLWIEKGKPNPQTDPNTGEVFDDFNCVDLELGWEDIIRLSDEIKNRRLPETGGFFFGGDSYDYRNDRGDYQDLKEGLIFLETARMVLDAGDKVVYSSWW